MMKSPLTFLLFLLFLALPLAAWADGDMQVKAEISQQLVTVGTPVEYTIILTSERDLPDPRRLRFQPAPKFQGFQVQPGSPSVSSRREIVNSFMSFTREIRWRLMPEKTGVAEVTSGNLLHEGKRYPLQSFKVKVVANQAETIPDELQEMGLIAANSDYPELNKRLQGKLFARLIISDTTPYLQETIRVRCVVYMDDLASNIRGIAWDAPEWDGFFAEEVDLGDNLSLDNTVLGGRRYQMVVLGEAYLTPTRTGKIEIPFHQARCGLRVQGGRSFEDRFFGFGHFDSMFDMGNRIEVRMPIAAQTIQVKPLPEESCPPSFQNAVGHFTFAGSVDRNRLPEDELLTLKLQVGGQGYLGSISNPELPPLKDWDVSGQQSETEALADILSRGGKKTFEILLRPRKTGQLTIPAISFAFFDPQEERYVEQTAGPFSIEVTKGKNRQLLVAGEGAQSLPPGEKAEFFGEQIAYIHAPWPGPSPSAPLYQKKWLFPLLVLPLLLFGMALGGRFWLDYIMQNQDMLKVRQAGGKARKELKRAAQVLRKDELDQFYASLGEALRDYLGTKLNRSPAGLTLDELERACQRCGVTPEDRKVLRVLLEHCDEARYMAQPPSREDAQAAYQEAHGLLKKLDKVNWS